MKTFLLGTISLLGLITMNLQSAPASPKKDTFKSGGKEIRLETYTTAGNPDAPALVVLHGSTGVEFADRFIAGIAESFAALGFTVHLIHYFDRTGTTFADDATIRKHSEAWRETVHDGIAHIKELQPHAPLGVFGYSLGGYHAAAEGVRNPNVGAIVVLAGGLDEASRRKADRAVPALVLHGATDKRVPVSEARSLVSHLKKMGGKPELHIYPEEGHIMLPSTYLDVLQRGAAFLSTHFQAP